MAGTGRGRQTGERSLATAEFECVVRRLADQRGLAVLHGFPVAARARGWPDVMIAGTSAVLFRRLLGDRAYLTPPIRSMLAVMTRAGLDVAVWRPRQLESGEIGAQLDFLAGGEMPPTGERQCLACPARFTPVSARNRFCSRRCRNLYYNRCRTWTRRMAYEPLPRGWYA